MRAPGIQQRSLPETPTSVMEQQQQQFDLTPTVMHRRSASMVTVEESDVSVYSDLTLTDSYDEPRDEEEHTCVGSLREAISRAGADEMRAILLNMTDTLGTLGNGLQPSGLQPNEHHSYYNLPGNGLNWY